MLMVEHCILPSEYVMYRSCVISFQLFIRSPTYYHYRYKLSCNEKCVYLSLFNEDAYVSNWLICHMAVKLNIYQYN